MIIRLLAICLLIPLLTWGQQRVDYLLRSANQIKDTAQSLPVAAVKRLVKAGVGLPLFRQSSLTPTWKAIGVDITLEHKLTKWLTFSGGLETNISFGRGTQLYSLEMPIGLRYYFSLGKRMKQRVDKHNFFSPYVGLQTHNVLFANLRYNNESGTGPGQSAAYYHRGQFVSERTNVGNLNEGFNLLQHGYLVVGSQFRTSVTNYLDVNVVVPAAFLIYHKTDYTLSTPSILTVKYGIFW